MSAIDELTWSEVEQIAVPISIGYASSAMKITYGCDHTVHRMNGDVIHHTCPFCYARKKVESNASN